MTDRLFWSRVRKTDTCWLWTGAKMADGYGNVARDGRNHRAHRYAYELTRGVIPEGRIVLHSCDNPLCVRPDHLRVGTWQENMDDMYSRGRERPSNRDRETCTRGHAIDGKDGRGRRFCTTCRKVSKNRYQRRVRAEECSA